MYGPPLTRLNTIECLSAPHSGRFRRPA